MAGFSARKGRNFNTSPSGINEVSGKDRDFHTIENAPGPGAMATGGTIVEPGDGYVYHVFTGDENFEPLVPSNQLKYVEYMLIGGGGGGGTGGTDPGDQSGGGGGGGGFVKGYASVTAGNTYPLVIGAGGQYSNAFPPYMACGTLGSPTSGFGQVAIGGGGGSASQPHPYSNANSNLGGSGGGGGWDYPTAGGGNLGNNADFDNPDSPQKGWQGHRGGESDITAPSEYASPSNALTVHYQDEFAGAGGGAGGRATKPPIAFFPTNATNNGYRLDAEYTRGPGKQLDEFTVANIGPAYPAPVAARLASPEIDGWGAGGGANTTLEPANTMFNDLPANKVFRERVGANSGAGGLGIPGASGTGSNFSPLGYGDSGVAVVRYKKNESGSLAARATGGNVVEPGNNANHFGMVRHIFTGPGTFTVTDSTLTSVRYLAVGGGGGGGNAPNPGSGPNPYTRYASGGGGAGGFVTSETGPMTAEGEHSFGNYETPAKLGKPYVVSSTETGGYPIVIGAGGGNFITAQNTSTPGGDTTIGAPGPEQIIAFGGGGGAGRYLNPQGIPQLGQSGSYLNGLPGGSGGGGACQYTWTPNTTIAYGGEAKTAGTGHEFSQGNPGYQGSHGLNPNTAYGSGGGGGGAGGNHLGSQALQTAYSSHGGWGMWSPLAPPNYGTPGPEPGKRYFAGGGGSGTYYGYMHPTDGGVVPEPFQAQPTTVGFTPGANYNQGGYGGGGNGGPGNNGTPGTTNTGGGGGGRYSCPSNFACTYGGSGIVIIEYPA